MWHAHVYDLFLIQDVARHQPKELVAKIEGREWCGELHLGRFEARLLFILPSRNKNVACFAFSWPGRQVILVACLRWGRGHSSFFFKLRVWALFVLLYIGARGDPPGLAEGHEVGRHAVPRDPWPSWVGHDWAAGRGAFLWFFSCPRWSVSFFWQDLAAEISGRRFRITLRKWSQARVFIFCFLFFPAKGFP